MSTSLFLSSRQCQCTVAVQTESSREAMGRGEEGDSREVEEAAWQHFPQSVTSLGFHGLPLPSLATNGPCLGTHPSLAPSMPISFPIYDL